MKIRILIILLFTIITRVSAQSYSWQWAVTNGGGGDEYVNSMDTDSSNNIYVCTRSNYTTMEKYDSSGVLVWSKFFANADPNAIVVNEGGDIYLTGEFLTDTLRIDSIILLNSSQISNPGQDIFFAKFDSEGNVQWAKRFGFTAADFGHCLTLDDSGYVYMGASFSDSISFDTIDFIGQNYEDICVIKFDWNGNAVWGVTGGSDAADYCNAICLDDSGNVHVSGVFQGMNFVFGSEVLAGNTGVGMRKLFNIKISKEGIPLWNRELGAAWDVWTEDIVCDQHGNTFVTGSFDGPSLGSSPHIVTNPGGLNAFLAKYDPAGNLIDLHSYGDSNDDEGGALEFDQYGNLFFAGNYENSVVIDSTFLSGTGRNIFVAKFDSSGDLLSVIDARGSSMTAYAYDLALDKNDMPLIGGAFKNIVEFGSSILTTGNNFDWYIAKLSLLSTGFNGLEIKNDLILSPNPTTGIVQFNSADLASAQLFIYSATGVRVLKTNFSMYKQLDLSEFGQGIYLYQLVQGGLIKRSGKILLQE